MQLAEPAAPHATGAAARERPRTCLIATCESWASTATLPALLARSGLEVTGLSPGVLSLSRHVTHKLRGSRDPRVAAAQLLEIASRRTFDWIVVADDALLRAVLRSAPRELLRPWFPVDPFDDDVLALVTSKHAFAERAPALGIPVPEGRVLATLEACLAEARALGYPVVLKGPYGFSGLEVFLAPDEDKLRAACARLLERYDKVLLQRFIAGAPASVAVLYERGEPVAYKAYLAECAFPHAHSAATVHRVLRHPGIEPVVRAVGAASGFNGMAGIDFVLENGTGRIFAIEINPRPTSAFSGLGADRDFFSPALARFLAREAAPLQTYPLRAAAQAYFPEYAFYFLSAGRRGEPDSLARLRACLAEARGAEFPVAAWAIGRYAYDRAGRWLPNVRAWIDALRRARA